MKHLSLVLGISSLLLGTCLAVACGSSDDGNDSGAFIGGSGGDDSGGSAGTGGTGGTVQAGKGGTAGKGGSTTGGTAGSSAGAGGSGTKENTNALCSDGIDNDNSGKGAQMDIDWGKSGTTAPFKTLDATHLDLDVSNSSIGSHHRIQVDPQDIDITALASDPSIVAAGGMIEFAITGQHGRATDNFSSFADFESALAMDLNGMTTALRLTADGQYDAASNTFTARRITILLSN